MSSRETPDWFCLDDYRMNSLSPEEWYSALRVRKGYFDTVLIGVNGQGEKLDSWRDYRVDSDFVGLCPEIFWEQFLSETREVEVAAPVKAVLEVNPFDPVLGYMGLKVNLRASDSDIHRELQSALDQCREKYTWPNPEVRPGPKVKQVKHDASRLVQSLRNYRVLAVFDLAFYGKIFDVDYGYDAIGRLVYGDNESAKNPPDTKTKARDALKDVIPRAFSKLEVLL